MSLEIYGSGERWYVGEFQPHSNLIKAITDYMPYEEAKAELRKRLHNQGKRMVESRGDWLQHRLKGIFSEALITSDENELVIAAVTYFLNFNSDAENAVKIVVQRDEA